MGIRTSDLVLELSRDLDRRSRDDRRSRETRSCSRSALSDRGPPFMSSLTPLQGQLKCQKQQLHIQYSSDPLCNAKTKHGQPRYTAAGVLRQRMHFLDCEVIFLDSKRF